MSEHRYKAVFYGEILEGFDREETIYRMTTFLNQDVNKVAKLFSGKAYVLKRSNDVSELEKIAVKLREIGIAVRILEQQQNHEQPAIPFETDVRQEKISPPSDTSKATAVSSVVDASDAGKVKNLSLKNLSINPLLKILLTKKHIYKYRFDTFMAKGGISIFKALVGVFIGIFLVVSALRALLFLINPDLAQQYGSLDVLGNVYITFLQLTDPGNMAQDILSSPWYKLFAVLSGIAGIVMLSALIAFITTALDQKISELKRGHSKVIEEGHTLILGWNEQRVLEIIRELIIANESEKDACVVILANEDKEYMDDVLRLRLPNRFTTRVVTRSGQITTLANLEIVSVETCGSIIVLASCEDTDKLENKIASDARVIQTILALSGRSRDDDSCIVAEIFNEAYRDIVEDTFGDQVVVVNTSDILAKLLVQTSRSVGLSVVYNELLSFDGCEIYFYHGRWNRVTFGRMVFHFEDGVPLGIQHEDGTIVLNPDTEYEMLDSDRIIIVADDDSTINFMAGAIVEPKRLPLPKKQLEQSVERELLIGWNHKAPIIINEFSDYVKPGSQIDVVLNNSDEEQRLEIERLNRECDNIDIKLINKNSLNRDHLISLQPFTYDNIIILANIKDGNQLQQVDSENIVTLLLVRSIFNDHLEESKNVKIITEILDSQNLPLVARAGVKDVIISNRLLSMVIAQISENKNIKKIYDDIFQEDGSEIYLKPAKLYFNQFPVTVTFADLILLAQRREEICIGVKIVAEELDSSKNNGVQLIPRKTSVFTLNAEDCLVVLAENEL